MAKQIKVIKCPQCGSVNKSVIKEDHYVCSNCGTEYFLDTDDININHNVNVNTNTPQRANTNKILKGIAIAFGIFILLSIIINIIGSLFSSKPSKTEHRAYSSAPAIPEEKEVWKDDKIYFFESTDKKPVFVRVGTRKKERDYSRESAKIYAGFYEGLSGKEIKIQELDMQVKKIEIDYRMFDDGNLYFILNKSKWFVVDKQFLSANEVSPELYQNIPELQPGIAKIEFVSEDFGSGFNIMSNAGKQLYYYPVIGKIYNQDKFYDANQNFNSVPSGTPAKTAFRFTRIMHDYPDENYLLISYRHKNADGYPRTSVSFGWQKDYAKYGLISDNTPFKKVLINNFNKNKARIVDFKDFTPDRLYFAPAVWADDDKYVLISFKPTPAEDALTSLQLLDANTADIIWTEQIEDGRISKVFEYDDAYCVRVSSDKYVFIDKNGKRLKEIKFED